MGPYLTRKYTSTTAKSQNLQEKIETLSRVKSKCNTKKESKTSDSSRIKSKRLITTLKNSSTRNQTDFSMETNQNDHDENERVIKNSKLKKVIGKKKPASAVKVVANNSSSTNKQEPKDVKERKIKKTINKNIFNLRQTSLRESFLNQSKQKLRVGQNVISPGNDLTLIKQYLSPKEQNSSVLVKKLNINREKMPIYKCILPEHSVKNSSEIYEFNFDVNDSKERLPKKRRRRVAAKKTLVSRKKKIISKNYNVQKVVSHKTKSNNVDFQEDNVKSANVKCKESDIGSINAVHKESNIKPTNTVLKKGDIKSTNVVHKENNVSPKDVTFQEMMEKKLNQPLQINISVKPSNENPLPESGEKSIINNIKLNEESLIHSMSDEINTEQPVNNITKRPKIVSMQNLNDKKITIMDNSQISTHHKLDDIKPFRFTNIFNKKLMVHQKNTLHNSLFEKSLSPITKLTENYEFSSPWRASPLFTFSQVRNVFQSTPQNKKYEISKKTFSRVSMNDSKNNENVIRGRDASLKNNENVSLEGHLNTSYSMKRNFATPRKFGTEITNIDHSVSSNLGEEIDGRVSSEIENVQPNAQLSNRVNTNLNHLSTHHNTENRINNVTNSHTPKKVVKIDKNKVQSPQKVVENIQMYNRKENLDPQPGPSGLQKNKILSERKNILRQSNLNNFLNVMDMPQSTSFKTPHGIFDDAPSTPISSKSGKSVSKSNLDVEDAFGFSDDSNEDTSPVKHKVASNSESHEKPFARLSLAEIKNNFLIKKSLKNIEPVKDINSEDVIKKVPLKTKQDMNTVPNFSDTFDILSEMGETSMKNTSEFQLFIDPEPSHFIEPPKHSYKRKRNVKFNFLDEENEEEKLPGYEIKRKKVNKMKKEQEKRLIEWVENINKTFDEIDQHELLIE